MMYTYIFLISALSCSFATEIQVRRENWIADFEKALREGSDLNNGIIVAHMNDFTDKLFGRIGKFAIDKGLDPKGLKDIDENFLLARIELKNGSIHGISTIKRYNDVIITYKHDEKKLGIIFPVEFSNLSFTYDYHVTLTLFGPQGGMLGAIHNFKMCIELSFDLTKYQAKIEKVSTIETGAIDLTFKGQILDFVFNLLSRFVSAILHPILVAIVEGIVNNVANIVVNAINNFFHQINLIS